MGEEPDGEANGAEDHEALKRARDKIEYIEDQVAHGKKLGVEFSEVEGLIQGARMMLGSGALNDAQELIDQAAEEASQRFTEFELLQANIKKLEKLIEEKPMADISGDAEKSLKMAKYHMGTGYYRLGNDYASRGLKVFTEKKEPEIKWGSGL